MNDLKTYLSTAPVLLTVWMSLTAGMLIELNRFYPDALFVINSRADTLTKLKKVKDCVFYKKLVS